MNSMVCVGLYLRGRGKSVKESWWMRSYGDNNKRNKDCGEPHIQQFQEQVRPNPGVDCISLWPAGSTLQSATFIQWCETLTCWGKLCITIQLVFMSFSYLLMP